MADLTPAFSGELQFRRYSDTSTQGQQVVFAVSDREALECFIGKEGKRFMAVLVEVGDDEQPVDVRNSDNKKVEKSHLNREPLGDLCRRAVMWCKEPEFQEWVSIRLDCHPAAVDEEKAKRFILHKCHVNSRKDLDGSPEAAFQFNQLIRGPYQKHLMARGAR